MSKVAADSPLRINFVRVFIPVLIGVGVSAYLLFTSFHPAELKAVSGSRQMVFWLIISILTVVARDGAFMYKIRLSAGNTMTWKKTFQTIMLWEFSSCILPKVGEAPFVVYLLKKSGLTYGKSTAIFMLNVFFDNLAFIVLLSMLYFVIGRRITEFSGLCSILQKHEILQGIRFAANHIWLGFLLFFFMCVFFGTFLFLIPHKGRQFFHWLSSFTFLVRFKSSIIHLGDDIELTSLEFKNKPISFWAKMATSTLVNWIARYLLAFTLLMAFATSNLDFFWVLSRQFSLWVFTSLPTTPGASGVAELSFIALNCDFMPAIFPLALAISFLWRVYSYWIYLFIGLLLLPKWAKQTV